MDTLFQGPSGRLLFVLLAMVAYFIGLSPHLLAWFTSGAAPDALVWNLTHYHVSYGEFGFLRRGLVGTGLAPIMAALPDGGSGEYLLMLGIDIALVLILALVAARLFLRGDGGAPGQGWLVAGILISPVGFVQLGFDAARLDHVNFCLAALAMLVLLRGWPLLAGGLMLAAVLTHEAALFYALPCIAAQAWAMHRRAAPLALVALPALGGAVALFLWGGVEADMSQALPANVSLAASVWSRDLLEPARGFAPLHYLIAAYFAVVPLFLAMRHYRLARARPDLLLLAPAACLALFALGVDYGRWGQCMFFAVMLMIAAAPALGRPRGVDLAPLSARAVVLPWLLPLGPIGIALLYPFIPWVV